MILWLAKSKHPKVSVCSVSVSMHKICHSKSALISKNKPAANNGSPLLTHLAACAFLGAFTECDKSGQLAFIAQKTENLHATTSLWLLVWYSMAKGIERNLFSTVHHPAEEWTKAYKSWFRPICPLPSQWIELTRHRWNASRHSEDPKDIRDACRVLEMCRAK